MIINHFNSDISFVYANSDNIFVYISNAGDGNIAVMKLNPETGDLTMVEKITAGPNVMHMAISPDQRFLYASVRSEPFSVISYSIDSETGKLPTLLTLLYNLIPEITSEIFKLFLRNIFATSLTAK